MKSIANEINELKKCQDRMEKKRKLLQCLEGFDQNSGLINCTGSNLILSESSVGDLIFANGAYVINHDNSPLKTKYRVSLLYVIVF